MATTLTKSDSAALMTEADVELLQREEGLKAELARIEKVLKPKKQAMLDKLGEGRFAVGKYQIELSCSYRESTSWKSVAYAVADEDVVNREKGKHTSNVEIIKVQIVQ